MRKLLGVLLALAAPAAGSDDDMADVWRGSIEYELGFGITAQADGCDATLDDAGDTTCTAFADRLDPECGDAFHALVRAHVALMLDVVATA